MWSEEERSLGGFCLEQMEGYRGINGDEVDAGWSRCVKTARISVLDMLNVRCLLDFKLERLNR